MCGQVNEDDLYTLHHEMGHLYYFLSYRHQPYLFRVSSIHKIIILVPSNFYPSITTFRPELIPRSTKPLAILSFMEQWLRSIDSDLDFSVQAETLNRKAYKNHSG